LTQSLLPDQVQGFENLAKEMQRAKALETLGAAQGSPTASYLGRGGLLRNDVLDYA
jgi:hypothetical protein